jgi:hypothetical protein
MTEFEKAQVRVDGQYCKICGALKHRGKCFQTDIVHIQRTDMELIAKAISSTEWPFLKALTYELSNLR